MPRQPVLDTDPGTGTGQGQHNATSESVTRPAAFRWCCSSCRAATTMNRASARSRRYGAGQVSPMAASRSPRAIAIRTATRNLYIVDKTARIPGLQDRRHDSCAGWVDAPTTPMASQPAFFRSRRQPDGRRHALLPGARVLARRQAASAPLGGKKGEKPGEFGFVTSIAHDSRQLYSPNMASSTGSRNSRPRATFTAMGRAWLEARPVHPPAEDDFRRP